MNINQFSKSEAVKQQLEELKNKERFDNLAEEVRAKTKIRELEEKSIEVIRLLEGFGVRIPTMIETLDLISKDMQTEEFKEMLTKLYNSVSGLESKQNVLNQEIKNMENSFDTYLKKTEEKTEKILDTYAKKSSLGKIINWVVIVSFVSLSFICGKTILKTQDNINFVNNRMFEIHQILKQEEKYWYDKDSKKLYLKEIKKNKQNKKSF